MRIICILILFFSSFIVTAQNAPDFAAIQKNVNDSASPYFYDMIAYQFRLDPNLLDSVAMQHLYYGKVYRRNPPLIFDNDYTSAIDLFNKRKYDKAIAAAGNMLLKDPVNLRMLEVMILSLEKTDTSSRYLPLYKYQAGKIISAFINVNDGKTEGTPFYVASVPDSYILLNLQVKNPGDYKRTSRSTPLGMMDVYKKGKNEIFVTVLYSLKEK